MGVELGAQLGAAALSGSALPYALGFLWRRLRKDPKAEAEARKLNAEADGMIVTRLYAEIERLDRELADLRNQMDQERRDCAKQIANMEGHIRQLQQHQTSFGHISGNQAEGPLKTAFPPIASDKDGDLIDKLNKMPGTRSAKRRR